MKTKIVLIATCCLAGLMACGSPQKKENNAKMEDVGSLDEATSDERLSEASEKTISEGSNWLLEGPVDAHYLATIKAKNLKDPVNADTIEVGFVEKTADEWREILKPKEFHILREGGTEPAFVNKYVDNKKEGIYYCGACGLPVYSSKTKFHSGTGWPSFWAPIDDKLVVRQPDKRFGMMRTEVVCAQCGSHFGHVFPNSTVPTGERHCLNSRALDFVAQKL